MDPPTAIIVRCRAFRLRLNPVLFDSVIYVVFVELCNRARAEVFLETGVQTKLAAIVCPSNKLASLAIKRSRG